MGNQLGTAASCVPHGLGENCSYLQLVSPKGTNLFELIAFFLMSEGAERSRCTLASVDLPFQGSGEVTNDIQPRLFNNNHFVFSNEVHMKDAVVSKAYD